VRERIEDLDATISFFAQDRRKFPVSQADKEPIFSPSEHLRYISIMPAMV
jgi:hypothetical protein